MSALQIKRGTTAKRTAYIPKAGELVFDTTLSKMFIGDGTTAGGIPVVATADKLFTPVTINGISFDGSGNITLPVFSTSGAGLVPARVGSTVTKFLREDGSWVVPTNTTYSAMTQAESDAGTSTTARLVTPAILKSAVVKHSPVQTTVSGNAGSATKLQTARTIGGVSFDGTANINLPGVNTAGNQSTSGNAATATTLQTARTINGVGFDGTANIIIGEPTFGNPLASYPSADANALNTGGFNVRYLNQAATNKPLGTDHAVMTLNYGGTWSGQQAFDWRTGNVFTRTQNNGAWLDWATQVDTRNYANTLPTFSVNGSGLVPARVGTTTTKYLREDGTWTVPPNTTYSAMSATEANTGTATTGQVITAAVLKGAIQTHAPAQTTVTGNAGTATKLQTARTIGGVSFDGTANINLPGVNTAGNQNTTGNAATATKLQTARTISLTGDATGSTTFDGSGNASIAVTVGDDSHNHTNLETLAMYSKVADDLPSAWPMGVSSTFVNAGVGYPSYGGVLNVKAYGNGGGTLQIYTPYGTGYGGDTIAMRFGNYNVSTGNSWTELKYVIHDKNIANYAPTKTGGGASGTWGIAITGNAATATKLQTARTIAISGAVTGTATSFDGSANIAIATTAIDGSKISTGTIPAARIPTLNQSTTGNAATATQLATARTINGVSFNGTANITVADSTKLPLAGGTVTGALTVSGLLTANGGFKGKYVTTDNRALKPSATPAGSFGAYFTSQGGLTGTANTAYGDLLTLNSYNDASGGLANALFVSKNSKSILHYQAAQGATTWGTPSQLAYVTDNVASATKLQAPVKINGIDFDGSQDIELPLTLSDGSPGSILSDFYFTFPATFILEASGTSTTLHTLRLTKNQNNGYFDVSKAIPPIGTSTPTINVRHIYGFNNSQSGNTNVVLTITDVTEDTNYIYVSATANKEFMSSYQSLTPFFSGYPKIDMVSGIPIAGRDSGLTFVTLSQDIDINSSVPWGVVISANDELNTVQYGIRFLPRYPNRIYFFRYNVGMSNNASTGNLSHVWLEAPPTSLNALFSKQYRIRIFH